MRISDDERQRAIAELRRHCAAGRLDVDEYAERIERAMGATTLEELDSVLGDLPMVRIADPGERDQGTQRPLGGLAGRLGLPAGEWHSGSRRLVDSLTVIASVVVVLLAVAFLIVFGWGWALALIIGWLVGMAQARWGHQLSRR